jgi:hypothetical protein
MQPKKCSYCDLLAEAPFTGGRSRLPEELADMAADQGVPMEREWLICVECLENLRSEKEYFQEIEPKIEDGTLCAMCHQEMDPPGGYALKSAAEPEADPPGGFDLMAGMPKMLRLCQRCHDNVVEDRRRRGIE